MAIAVQYFWFISHKRCTSTQHRPERPPVYVLLNVWCFFSYGMEPQLEQS